MQKDFVNYFNGHNSVTCRTLFAVLVYAAGAGSAEKTEERARGSRGATVRLFQAQYGRGDQRPRGKEQRRYSADHASPSYGHELCRARRSGHAATVQDTVWSVLYIALD